MIVKAFSSPKLGNSSAETEDAYAFNTERGKVAVADGASDSIFSGLWARALVSSYVNSDLSLKQSNFMDLLINAARMKWHSEIEWDALRLFIKNKAVAGSYSTIIFLESLDGPAFRHARALSVGDSCLLIKRKEVLISFPIVRHEDFNISPKLVWSGYGAPFKGDYRWNLPEFLMKDFYILPDDSVIVATDAVSKWIIQYFPESWDIVTSDQDLKEVFTKEVRERRMRNDDLTFLRVITGS